MTKNEYEYKAIIFKDAKIQAKTLLQTHQERKKQSHTYKNSNGHRDVK